MPSLNELKRSIAKHVILFGLPKSGKSLTAGKLAEHGFSLKWFDADNGRNVLYQLSLEAQKRIEIFVIPDTKEHPIAAETFSLVLKGTRQRICWEHGKVSCALCMKSCPANFSSICLNELGENEIAVFDSLTQWSNSIMSNIGLAKDDTWRPEWEHYRTQGAVLDRGLSNVQNAPWNCIFITHEASIPMEDGKEKIVPVAGTAAFSRNTARYFDEVVYCEIKNRRHIAGSSSLYAPNVLTGSRTGIKTEEDSEMSLLKIFRGEGEKKESEAVKHLQEVRKEIGK